VPFKACSSVPRHVMRIFIRLSLGSVGPEDWLVILRPGIGVFDLKKEPVFEWLDLPCLGIRCSRGFYRLGSFALVARCGGHPGGGVLGLEVDDGTVVGIEDPADGGRWCTGCAGFGQNDGFPETEAFELTAYFIGILNGLVRAHFAAAAGALQRVAAPDGEDALAPAATVPEG